MPDAVAAVDGRFLNDLLEISKLSGSTANLELSGRIDDCDPGGVIAAVLKLAKPFDDDRNNLFWADVTDDSAHAGNLLRSPSKSVACETKGLVNSKVV
jgi:hypothetical protein